MEEKDAWLRDVRACFATDTYLQTFFKAKDRVTFAKDRLREQSVGFAPDHDKVLPAKRFLERVEQYVKNVQHNLEDDAVPAPVGLQGPWLLWRPASLALLTPRFEASKPSSARLVLLTLPRNQSQPLSKVICT